MLGLDEKRKTETTLSDLTASRVQHQKRAFHKGQRFDLMSEISANQRSVTHSWGGGSGMRHCCHFSLQEAEKTQGLGALPR